MQDAKKIDRRITSISKLLIDIFKTTSEKLKNRRFHKCLQLNP
jgi:hypothetical protein